MKRLWGRILCSRLVDTHVPEFRWPALRCELCGAQWSQVQGRWLRGRT